MPDIILRNAMIHPRREAFVYGEQRVSFQEYNARVNGLVHALHGLGIRKGDVIGVLSWNCMGYMEIFGAAAKGGFIISPFNVRLSAGEVEYLVNNSEAVALFVGSGMGELLKGIAGKIPRVRHFISLEEPIPGMDAEEELVCRFPRTEPSVEIQETDPLFICYTSGTTGLPRGALYTHARVREDILCHSVEVPIGPQDRGISLMPLFHIGGIEVNHYLLYNGATNIIMKTFDPPAFLKVIERERITNIVLVPTHLAVLLDLPGIHKTDVRSVKRIYYAGSPMPTEILKKGMSVFGPVFFQGYGQTESGPVVAFLKESDHLVLDKPPDQQRVLLSIGHAATGVHVRIVDEEGVDLPPGEVGEIIAKSRHVMEGYWRKPEETAQVLKDGWLHTRDMGTYDEQGYIYIVDRKQDMIISGGENIYPREVEEVLYRHPAVSECSVIGVPDPKWVEAVHAVVCLKRGSSAKPDELIEFCKRHLAKYKAPKSVDIVRELPKNAAGKILKREIRKGYWPSPPGSRAT
jgi:acyl-CoA synthetase (AMP-forming)/AMP-acid ligase II